ncbi:substrate-binding domain-containing protein [Cohnella sp. GCM10027633]|uniref:substrate-binding domain-containing protein n=1 Tax=unclassified Cohnella TaxID=2636738 RepID=UPI00362B70D1
MSGDMSYTTEEIAKLLKISKLTVYDLIKKGELPSYRVGKQMRVDAVDLEAYKQRAKGVSYQEKAQSVVLPAQVIDAPAPVGVRRLVITGQDIGLDLLTKQIEKQVPGTRALRAYAGSLDSLISMYRGEADIVSTHLLDGDTGEYNLPYIRKLLVGAPYVVVNLLSREAGMFVQEGNPLGLRTWGDLGKPNIRLVNRERGSGARVLLDEQLRLHGIAAEGIAGYDTEESNHLGVAGKVASGAADVGVGTARAATIVGNVDFVPLIKERYDLVMLKRPENKGWIEAVLRVLRSDALREELGAIGGYDLSLTGRIMADT